MIGKLDLSTFVKDKEQVGKLFSSLAIRTDNYKYSVLQTRKQVTLVAGLADYWIDLCSNIQSPTNPAAYTDLESYKKGSIFVGSVAPYYGIVSGLTLAGKLRVYPRPFKRWDNGFPATTEQDMPYVAYVDANTEYETTLKLDVCAPVLQVSKGGNFALDIILYQSGFILTPML